MDSDPSIQNGIEMDLELLTRHIDGALSAAVINKSCRSDKGEGGTEFSDFVQPASSAFIELLEGRISEGSKLFSNQKSLSSSTWATDARTVAVDVLRGVSNIHWSAVGLLAVAIVLERLDKISSNDRECVDLLRGMNDLAKCIKQLQEIKAHLHKEIREKMSEGVYLIITGALMCTSVIRSKKLSKFLLSTKIREELNFLRGQVDRMFRDIMLQVQLKTLFSFMSYTSLQSTPEAPGGIWSQSEKDVAETSSQGQIHRNAISFNSQQTNHHQPFNWNHGHSSQIASHRRNNHYQRKGIISLIVRGIRGGRKTVGDEKYERLVLQKGMKDLVLGTTVFPFNEIQIACQYFHPKNKLGEGGFGSVYKGTFADGKQLAIKRISEEGRSLFTNEWGIASRLQHRNLIKLYGFCIEGDEILLIYEYMPKGSLQDLCFNPSKVQVLDWRTHLNIFEGVARGLAYLHEDSGICIVHRDIKPSNILLDENFNAKIADFGLGRVLDKNDIHQNIPVAGTEGYIAPECKSDGRVTDKADVFSFGVVVLQIMSGKRQVESNFSFPDLVKWAWNLHEENRHFDLVDSRLLCSENFDSKIAMRVILIALQCTQEARLRPSMSKVSFLLSLSSEAEIGMPTLTKPDYLCNS
ncbi:probable serine/threonine-protein kinase PBL4 isoform X1 [Cryptomeria japonica]|uniref:probable serine/threonine-protein kinase PBL4 isoform X1 n=1 Tax=Cryptomeria japonica TaxID=3369 RepID=UPI0025ABA048|nr:probable serine/threonine-protein kinase PBL4 isoform X1 [Cryptomeria japonica]